MPPAAGSARAPHLLFVVNEDWFFLSHRLPLARAAREAGMRVTVAAADTGGSARIRNEGLGFVALPAARGRPGALAETRLLVTLAGLYRRLRPELIHHVTIRPVLYGSLAARMLPSARVVNAVSGLGYVFTEGPEARAGLRYLVEALYRTALRRPGTRTIFQNPDDREVFVSRGIVRWGETVLIRGSGVDPAEFAPAPEPPGVPVVMLPSRMLWDKGVADFVAAARLLRARGASARFVLAGEPYAGNPTSIAEEQLRAWDDEGVVEWWGHRPDMPRALAEAAVVVLPSKREGLPKVLLEAASVGRPMVAADVPGCREVVRPGHTGYLVPPESPEALADAVGRLLADPAERRALGARARAMVEAEFTVAVVAERTLALYRELLDGCPGT